MTCRKRIALSTYIHNYLLTPWSRILLENLTGSQLVKKFPAYIEQENSLPHSQVSATRPCPEPYQSSPFPPSNFPMIHLKNYPPIYACMLQVVFFPKVFPPKSCMHVSQLPYMLHTPPTTFLPYIIYTE
jgi:hypothetical protein